jgi:alpha-tubulin suppressor-like RCC1 family protein
MPITLNHSNINIQYSTGSNYIIETVKSDLYINKDTVGTISNLTAEPYIESVSRMYPPLRTFTTNNSDITSNYVVSIASAGNYLGTNNYPGHSMFLTNTGRVYGCGFNNKGQLGLGNTNTGPTTPTLLNTSPFNTLTISAVSCGYEHTMFLTNTGRVYGCGLNTSGELGLGNTTSPVSTPTLLNTSPFNTVTISAISAAGNYTLFLTNTGRVYGCGLNTSGELGLGNTTSPVSTPTLIDSSPFNTLTISAIATGCTAHSIFLTNTGRVYACGNNGYGKLGTGNTTNQSTPTLLNTSPFNTLTITSIACGSFHTLFITNTGRVYSTGYNGFGELGHGDTTNRSTPALIDSSPFNSLTITAAAGGEYLSFFLTNTGRVYSCGMNDVGQMGVGDTTNRSTPTLLNTSPFNTLNIYAIAGGFRNCSFITNNGNAYSTGHNVYGQLGIGNNTNVSSPTVVSTFSLSTFYGSGLYTVSYSTFTTSFEPFRCFNSSSTANNPAQWRVGDYTAGAFNSNLNLVSDYNGDWLVIKLPVSIKLKKFDITQISTALNRAPKNFRLYGSTNGSSWSLLVDKQNTTYSNLLYVHTDMSQYPSATNQYYNHFGIVVNSLLGSTETTLSFDELFIYGVELITPLNINSTNKSLTIPYIPPIFYPNSNLNYNLNFPAPTFVNNISTSSNIILQGEYSLNILNSSSSQIIPKGGQTNIISIPRLSLPTTNIAVNYHLLNPLKDPVGAQWTYSSNNTNVYHMGSVGIGTTSPEYQLDVRGAIYSSVGGITQTGLTTWSITSDRRIKENITRASYDKCLENVKNIELYNFNFKNNCVNTNDKHQLGFIAQEVQQVYPKAVEVGKMILNTNEAIDDILTLNTTQIDYTLYGAVKNLIEKIEDIDNDLENIEKAVGMGGTAGGAAPNAGN